MISLHIRLGPEAKITTLLPGLGTRIETRLLVQGQVPRCLVAGHAHALNRPSLPGESGAYDITHLKQNPYNLRNPFGSTVIYISLIK